MVKKAVKYFARCVKLGKEKLRIVLYQEEQQNRVTEEENRDFHENVFDFVLKPIGKEPSARKIIRPFRTDLIEKMNIKAGDIVVARPMGAGCPVTHVLKVYEVDELAGLLYTWVVGPQYARGKDVKDIRAYAMGIFVFAYIMISSTSEPTFHNSVTIPLAMMLGYIFTLEKQYVKETERHCDRHLSV